MKRVVAFILLLSVRSYGALFCPSGTVYYEESKSETTQMWCQKKDKKHGPLVVKTKDGTTILKSNYENDKFDGEFQKFFDSGSILVKGFYDEGVATGYWTRYWPNGKVRDQGNWYENKPDGYWEFYTENGKLEKKEHYRNSPRSGRFKIRFSDIDIEVPGPESESYNELGLGADILLKKFNKMAKLVTVLDFTKIRVRDRSGPPYYTEEEKSMTILTVALGLDLGAPDWTGFSFMPKLGSLLLDFGDETEFLRGVELRYNFDRRYFSHFDYLFISAIATGQKEDEALVHMLGFAGSL